MENSKNQLKPGNYMKVSKVNEFIENHFKFTLSDIVKKTCKIHEGEFDSYYDTADLKNVCAPFIFKEMECDCVTYMILSK